MARIRSIKPEFFSDEKLSRLDVLTRFVFVGLVCNADDAGRLVDNIKLIDGLLFSNTDDTCRDALDTLARLGRVLRYTSASGQALIQITNWSRHQKVDKPSKYNLPAPDEASGVADSEAQPPQAVTRTREVDAKPSRKTRETLAPRSSINDHRSSTSDHHSATKAAVHETWLTPFCQAWKHRAGGEMLVGSEMLIDRKTKPLSQLVDQHGADETLRRWKIYLAATAVGYLSTAYFASTFGEWAEERQKSASGASSSPLYAKAETLWAWYKEHGLTRRLPIAEIHRIGDRLIAAGHYVARAEFLDELRLADPATLAEARTDRWAIEQIAERLNKPTPSAVRIA